MTLENMTTLSPSTTTELMNIPFEVVSKQDCINYVASTTRTNYILMGCLLLLGIGMLIYVNRNRFKWYQSFQVKKQMFDTLANKDTMEDLGKQFSKMFETVEPKCLICNTDLVDGKCNKCQPELVDLPTDFKEDK